MLMSGCFSSVSQVYRKRDRLDPGGDNRCDGAEHDRGCATSFAGGDCSFVAGEIAASQEIEPVSFSRRCRPASRDAGRPERYTRHGDGRSNVTEANCRSSSRWARPAAGNRLLAISRGPPGGALPSVNMTDVVFGSMWDRVISCRNCQRETRATLALDL